MKQRKSLHTHSHTKQINNYADTSDSQHPEQRPLKSVVYRLMCPRNPEIPTCPPKCLEWYKYMVKYSIIIFEFFLGSNSDSQSACRGHNRVIAPGFSTGIKRPSWEVLMYRIQCWGGWEITLDQSVDCMWVCGSYWVSKCGGKNISEVNKS